MSGPIVRTGTTPEFWKNYDRIFGEPKPAGGKKAAKKASTAAAAPAKKAAKKASKKAAKKTSGGQS
ncbi:MAG: RNA polymerase subunit sigma [Planctomyces sp.]